MFHLFTGIVALSSLLSFLNKRVLKLPETIGVMILALLVSIIVATFNSLGSGVFLHLNELLNSLDFETILFDFLLAFLLFAGAIDVNVQNLIKERGPVIVYATIGVLVSTVLIGALLFYGSQLLGLDIDIWYCLVLGALISPTDPIAVLALLQKAGTPKDLEIKIVGESLFNDGVGIVVFTSVLAIANLEDGQQIEFSHFLIDFIREAFGGLTLGCVLGWAGIQFLKRITSAPLLSVHITVALVMGGYYLATALEVSGALAMVVLGLMIGNFLHKSQKDQAIQGHIDTFWSSLDDIFNAILFVMMGLEIIIIGFETDYLLLGVLGILVVLFSRFMSVWLANIFLKKKHRSSINQLTIMTWAGLRGGISIGLALSLPDGPYRDIIIFVTYFVVLFSIIVQGLTIDKLVLKLLKKT